MDGSARMSGSGAVGVGDGTAAPVGRAAAGAAVLAAAALLVAGAVRTERFAPQPAPAGVAGSGQPAPPVLALTDGPGAFFQLAWPPVLAAVAVVLLCGVGYRVVRTPGAKRLTAAACGLALLGSLLHLIRLVGDRFEGSEQERLLTPLQAAGFAATTLIATSLALAVPLALLIAVRFLTMAAAPLALLVAVRLLRRRPPDDRQPLDARDLVPPPRRDCRPLLPDTLWRLLRGQRPATPAAAHIAGIPTQGQAAPQGRWTAAYAVPGLTDDDKRQLGICVSGGGVRSASVTLGALQALRSAKNNPLRRARWLVSVSGGGYTAGAFRLALQPPVHGPAGPDVSAETVFAPGSAEEDHIRRHSSYIADGAAQWIVAAAALLRGVTVSLLLVGLTLGSAAVLLGVFYRVSGVADLSSLAPRWDQPPGGCGDAGAFCHAYPAPGEGVLAALLGGAGLSALLYLAGVVKYSCTGRPSRRLHRAAAWAAAVTGLLALLGLAVPSLAWASVRLTWSFGPEKGIGVAATGAAGAAGTVLLTYVATVVAVLWRGRQLIGRRLQSLRQVFFGRSGSAKQAVAKAPTQRVVVYAALALLVLVFLFLFGGAVHAAAALWSPRRLSWMALVVVIACLIACLIDQTWLSLHPFYRRRLASAFAVRRGPHGSAKAYDYDTEPTTLSQYAAYDPAVGFPQVIFAAAASLSGQEHAPPGRRAVSFTMSADYVGGPDVGWVRTSALERMTSAHLRRDLSVQAAVAISGAAFASAMGRKARAAQTLLALSNARLGTWLPNPAFLHEWNRQRDWTSPPIPRLRGLGYLLREVVGSFPCDDRLLLVTDGGHYENLGLVELLRRCPRQVVCIDASGDAPPLASALADALRLAREELGIEIRLDDPLGLVPGSARPMQPDQVLSSLNDRLSRRAVVTGTYRYPPESGLPASQRSGQIVIAKSSLCEDMPYDLLAYASRSPVFPRDSTADQWFDSDQFESYLQLGRYLGSKAADALSAIDAKTARRGAADKAAATSAASRLGAPVR